MRKFPLLLSLLMLLLGSIPAAAQDTCCCCKLQQSGQERFARGNYPAAIRLWERAQRCTDYAQCPELPRLVQQARKMGEIKVPAGLAFIPGGTYEMGNVMRDSVRIAEPVHRVTVSDFLLARHEVTFREYDDFCEATGRTKPSDRRWGRGRRPVINVSWYDAVEYCNWRSARERLTPAYSIDKSRTDPGNHSTADQLKWTVTYDRSADGYRLPTEAEWEYAAREGGRAVRFGDGRDFLDPDRANFNADARFKSWYSLSGRTRLKTVAVDKLAANRLGLKQMTGNVGEWCWDWHDPAYAPSAAVPDPAGPPSGEFRAYRGGDYATLPWACRVSFRSRMAPSGATGLVGFRLARSR
jgi:sulfatase modifying factor 1